MLNEEALKMVGPSFEETTTDTKGATVSPDSTPAISVLTLAYSPVVSISVYSFAHSKR